MSPQRVTILHGQVVVDGGKRGERMAVSHRNKKKTCMREIDEFYNHLFVTPNHESKTEPHKQPPPRGHFFYWTYPLKMGFSSAPLCISPIPNIFPDQNNNYIFVSFF